MLIFSYGVKTPIRKFLTPDYQLLTISPSSVAISLFQDPNLRLTGTFFQTNGLKNSRLGIARRRLCNVVAEILLYVCGVK